MLPARECLSLLCDPGTIQLLSMLSSASKCPGVTDCSDVLPGVLIVVLIYNRTPFHFGVCLNSAEMQTRIWCVKLVLSPQKSLVHKILDRILDMFLSLTKSWNLFVPNVLLQIGKWNETTGKKKKKLWILLLKKSASILLSVNSALGSYRMHPWDLKEFLVCWASWRLCSS